MPVELSPGRADRIGLEFKSQMSSDALSKSRLKKIRKRWSGVDLTKFESVHGMRRRNVGMLYQWRVGDCMQVCPIIVYYIIR